MSEFSESYHLRGNDVNEAISLLKKVKLKGIVFKPENDWITFLTSGDKFETNLELVEFNTGTLLHYVFCADHGWFIKVFNKTEQVLDYGITFPLFGNDVETNEEVNFENLSNCLKIGDGEKEKELVELLTEYFSLKGKEAFDRKRAYKFVELVGINRYFWLSYDYVYPDIECGDVPEDDKDNIIIVN